MPIRLPLVDYLVLTPLDEEWRTVRSVLCPDHSHLKSKWLDPFAYYLWTQHTENQDAPGDYLIVAASMGQKTAGQANAGIFTSESVSRWNPQSVVLIGICGSIEPDKVQLGDVVVPDDIFGYEVGDAVGKRVRYRCTFNQSGASDLNFVRMLRQDPIAYWQWQEDCREAASDAGLLDVTRLPELHVAAMGSGNEVVKSGTFGRRLKNEISPYICAIEMEGRGVYQALYNQTQRRDALMIRGVSDYADKNKTKLEKTTKDAWRAFAAANAARLLKTIWQRVPAAPLSPSYLLNLITGPHMRFRQPDIPNIEYKQVGAQHIAFPHLIDRQQQSTPSLTLQVTASGETVTEFRGQCIVTPPRRKAINGTIKGNRMTFEIPSSERGQKVELLLSFPSAIGSIEVTCKDDFGRSCTASWPN